MGVAPGTAEQGSAEPRSRGPTCGDATVEPIMGASLMPIPLRVSGVRSPEGPLFRRVDAPRAFSGMRPGTGAGADVMAVELVILNQRRHRERWSRSN